MSKKKTLNDVLELGSLNLDIDDYKEDEVEYIIEFLEMIYKNCNNINNSKFDDLDINSIKTIDMDDKENGKKDT